MTEAEMLRRIKLAIDLQAKGARPPVFGDQGDLKVLAYGETQEGVEFVVIETSTGQWAVMDEGNVLPAVCQTVH